MAKEIETKLVVLTDEPQLFMDELAARSSFCEYRLTSSKVRVFKDTYYDTGARSLLGKGIALRTREMEGSMLFCIKQDEHIDAAGTATREEKEMPWSRKCLDHAMHIMQETSQLYDKIPSDIHSPSQILACLGLMPIQERETRRVAFDISCPSEREIIAELALDVTCYCTSWYRIFHYEIEVEAKKPSYKPHIICLTDIIRQAYQDRLMPWSHNKLITGLALEQLVAKRELSIIPGKTSHLDCSSYDVIDSFIQEWHEAQSIRL
jgi:hypothetical protein